MFVVFKRNSIKIFSHPYNFIATYKIFLLKGLWVSTSYMHSPSEKDTKCSRLTSSLQRISTTHTPVSLSSRLIFSKRTKIPSKRLQKILPPIKRSLMWWLISDLAFLSSPFDRLSRIFTVKLRPNRHPINLLGKNLFLHYSASTRRRVLYR